MKVSVYDTYVPKGNNIVMHFDILVKDNESIENVYVYGKDYLNNIGVPNYKLSTNECKFCHMEKAPDDVEKQILDKGYYIIEMENCN